MKFKNYDKNSIEKENNKNFLSLRLLKHIGQLFDTE